MYTNALFWVMKKPKKICSVPVIERLLAPRLIIELVICRFIHGKTHKAYFPWDQILYLPCSLTVQIILKKIFVGYVEQW